MTTRQKALDYLQRHDSATSSELCSELGISRQALNIHLRALMHAGQVAKTGSTRATRYFLLDQSPRAVEYKKTYVLNGLAESLVYERVATILNLESLLSHDQESIINYAFTEMLNNAIDHSKAEKCDVRVSIDAGSTIFEIRDRGVGVFQSIVSKFALEDEHAAMIDLMKGKTTTMPEAHTGEGIFFTSKAADKFSLHSHRIRIEWDRIADDVFVSKARYLQGTKVSFALRRDTKIRLESVFSEFAPEEYGFEFAKTKVFIKLLKSEYISRSEAKRLIVNLDRFREILLDFKGVSQLGQGFADEVFRVFSGQHPHITIRTANTDAAIKAMISHAINSKTLSK